MQFINSNLNSVIVLLCSNYIIIEPLLSQLHGTVNSAILQ